jgi:hypothetical protein
MRECKGIVRVMLKLGLAMVTLSAFTQVGCGKSKDAADDYVMKSKATEAKLMLNKLGKMAQMYFMERGQFPAGKVPLTPAAPCCKGAKGECAPDPAQWQAAEPFKALDFIVDMPHRFQYSYESDGKTATATAVGDLNCDGKTITFKLDLTGGEGPAAMNIVEPPSLH